MLGINIKKSVTLIIFLVIVLLILIISSFKSDIEKDKHGYYLNINNKEINLIMASTSESKELGLGGRESLPEDTAMLFTFNYSSKIGIWMKDMKFSIDIIWLDNDGKIITIANNISPDTYPKVFSPVGNSSFVLETNAGFAKKNNLSVGNFLNLVLK